MSDFGVLFGLQIVWVGNMGLKLFMHTGQCYISKSHEISGKFHVFI